VSRPGAIVIDAQPARIEAPFEAPPKTKSNDRRF
jgi:hypothetical protein